MEKIHLNENKFNLYKLYAVRRRVSSMVEGIHYGGGISSVSGGYSVQMCHTISMEEAHHQYSGGYAV